MHWLYSVLKLRISVLVLSTLYIGLIPISGSAQDRECVVVIQGWEKPKGYKDDNNGGKVRKTEEEFITNAVDEVVRGFRQYPKGAKVTALRPSNRKGATGGDGYNNVDDLLKQLEKAVCDADCDDVVIALIGHGNEFGGVFAAAEVGNPNKAKPLHQEDLRKIIEKCKTKIKLINASCMSDLYNRTVVDPGGEMTDEEIKSLFEIVMAACKETQCAKAIEGRSTYFTKYFMQDYYQIITDPNVMKQIEDESKRLRKAAQAEADKINAANAKGAAEDEKEPPMPPIEGELELPEATPEEKAKADAAAQKALEELIAERKKDLEKIRKELEEIPDTWKDYDGPGEPKSSDAIPKLINDKVQKALDLIKRLPEKEQKKELDKLKESLGELRNPQGAFNRVVYIAAQKARKLVNDALKALKNKPPTAKPAPPKPDPKPAPAIPKPPQKPAPAKVKPKTTPSIMALVLHYAFKSAKVKSKAANSGQDAVETVTPETDESKVTLPEKAPISIWVPIGSGYRFTFYKVMDKTKTPAECAIVGYVSDKRGIPLSKIISKKCDIDCSKTEFTFIDEKNNIRQVSIASGDKPKATIDGKTKDVSYKDKVSSSQRIPIIIDGKKVGSIRIIFRMGKKPLIMGYDIYGSPTFNGGLEVEFVSYDKEKGIVVLKVKVDGKWRTVTIKIKAHGIKEVTIDKQKPYKEYLASNYGLHDKLGKRIGGATLINYDGDLEGEIWLAENNTSYPASGFYLDDGTMLVEAKTSQGTYSIITTYNNGMIDLHWWNGTEGGDVQHTYYDPEINWKNDINLTKNQQPYSINLNWQTDYTFSDEDQDLLGYEIVRYTEGEDETEYFEVNMGTEGFTDKTAQADKAYTYHISLISDNYAIDDLYDPARYPFYSRPTVVYVEPEAEENDTEDSETNGNFEIGAINGTGQTTGHIADLTIELKDETSTPFVIDIGPAYIPSTDGFQPYYVPQQWLIADPEGDTYMDYANDAVQLPLAPNKPKKDKENYTFETDDNSNVTPAPSDKEKEDGKIKPHTGNVDVVLGSDGKPKGHDYDPPNNVVPIPNPQDEPKAKPIEIPSSEGDDTTAPGQGTKGKPGNYDYDPPERVVPVPKPKEKPGNNTTAPVFSLPEGVPLGQVVLDGSVPKAEDIIPLIDDGDAITIKVPIKGYCVDIRKPPVGLGGIVPNIENWTFLSEDISSGTIATPNWSAENGWNPIPAVTEPKSELPVGQTISIPGTETPINYTIDINQHPETVLPILAEVVKQVESAYDDLKEKDLINTPFSNQPTKEKEAVVQQVFWQYTAELEGEPYTVEEFTEQLKDQFKEKTGTSINKAPDAVQDQLNEGATNFWDAFELVGTEAKVIKTP